MMYKKNIFKKTNKEKQKVLIIALFFILIFTNIFSLIKVNSLNKKYSSNNPYPLVSIARNFIPQSDFITNLQPLRSDINKKANEFGLEKVSIYIEYLNTGANIAINPDNYIWPASLLKLPLAISVMEKVELKEWKLSDQLVIMPGDIDPRSGDPNSRIYNSPAGTRFTVEELLRELVVNSDNTAYNILARNTTEVDVKRVVDAIGLESLAVDSGKISAKEYSRILRSLYTASLLNRENSQKVLSWLDESGFNEYLAKPLPKDVIFAHKYGRNVKSNVYADSGIVYIGNRAYIISVMIQGDKDKNDIEEENKAVELMHYISKASYDYFSKYNN